MRDMKILQLDTCLLSCILLFQPFSLINSMLAPSLPVLHRGFIWEKLVIIYTEQPTSSDDCVNTSRQGGTGGLDCTRKLLVHRLIK